MSEAEANARRANRWTWACIALLAVGAFGSAASFAFVAVLFGIAGYGCAIWCASAKGYSWYLGLLGPFVAVALPSLHPIMEKIERSRDAVSSNEGWD